METATAPVSMSDFADIVDANEATWAYLNALDTDELRQRLFPIVRGEMASIQRARTRATEDAVFGGEGDGPEAERLPVDLLANRLALVTESFALADGTRVKWLEATPAQHRERAEMQRRLAGKCVVDAERHEQAAKVIEEFNVTCLAEIES